METHSEEYRRICEARSWLRQGYTDKRSVDALVARISAVRGQDAADQLRQDMRRQWLCRQDWLADPPAAS